MSTYQWNPAALGQVLMVPAAVADDLLNLAGEEQLKVLLWFSRHGQDWDAAACAAALQMPADQCEGCLRFWVEQGVLTVPDAPVAAPVEKTSVAEPPKTAPRAAAVKPQWKEVLRYQQEHREFNDFLQEVSARLGRPLNHGDNATLMYLVTTAGIPLPSVLMAVAYAVSINKASIRSIEGMVLRWADEDVITPEQVDGKIRQLQQEREAAAKVEKVLSLTRSLTSSQAKMAVVWLNEWSFSDAMLQQAYAIMMEKCKDKLNIPYMNGILERWQAEGIHTPDRIVAAPVKKKGAASTNPEESSLQSDELEQQLLQYRPKFVQK